MTPEQRLALIHEVMTTMYTATETFTHRNIGTNLAYLCFAIAAPEISSNVWCVNPGNDDDEYFLELLKKTFGLTHDVFKYIIH